MHRDDHILDRAFGEMLGRARACGVAHRTVGMVIGVQTRAGTTTLTRGLIP